MSKISDAVTLHPYFKIHPGKEAEANALLQAFVAKSATEDKSLFYEFTVNGDVIFCREGYVGAEGLFAHLANVDALIAEMLKVTDLARLEVHGPAEELEKLKDALAPLNPAWFTITCGVKA